MPRPTVPEGLSAKGRKLWIAVKNEREDEGGRLSAGEKVMLEEACRIADRLDNLAMAIDTGAFYEYVRDNEAENEEGVVYNLVVNNALAEARLQATAFRGYMLSLGLTSGAEKVANRPTKGRGGPRQPTFVDENGRRKTGTGDPVSDISSRRQRRQAGGSAGS